jgi:hypothetical protein
MPQIVTARRMSHPITIHAVITPTIQPASPIQNVLICQSKCDSIQVPRTSSRFT